MLPVWVPEEQRKEVKIVVAHFKVLVPILELRAHLPSSVTSTTTDLVARN